jgi:glycosyltransferase involved in cell wall biosynthesis
MADQTDTTVIDDSLPSASVECLIEPSLDALFWQAGRIGEPSAWWRHVPFAHWVVRATRPETLVELGTHAGVSYSAFCHAVIQSRLPTRCWAIDTWAGDEHAGTYSEAVYSDIRDFNEKHYSSFSTLLRCRFDEALHSFVDKSIDLLHIDGLHTYEAVRHDFESWLPKLSDRGVILFHDTNVLERDFGVWRLFHELRERYPVFEFIHGHGLGVVGVGGQLPSDIRALLSIREPRDVSRVRQRFAWLGERWLAETREHMIAAELGQRAVTAEQATQAAIAAADTATARAEQATRELAEAREAEKRARERAAEAERRLKTAEAMRAQAAYRADRSRRELDDARKAEPAEIAAARAQITALSAELLKTTNDYLQIVHSTTWRATQPMRRAGEALPPGVKRLVRRSARLAWWTITLRLPRRLAERRAAIALAREPAEAVPVSAAQPAKQPTGVAAIRDSDVDRLGHPPRVVYVSGEADTPGHLYRVERPVAVLRQLGVAASVIAMADVGQSHDLISRTDVLVLWRTPWSDDIATAIGVVHDHGGRVIFDVDDLMIDPGLARNKIIDGIRSQQLTEEQVASHFGRVRQTMLAADLCTASSEELVDHMRSAWKPARVLLNGFDHDTLLTSRLAARNWAHARDGLFRIGYAGGSRTHQRDFALCVDAVSQVLRDNPAARLVLFRQGTLPLLDVEEFPALNDLKSQIEWREFAPLSGLPDEVARFDVNLAPLEIGNPFCEAKSELKYFEAALVDVPTIASATGPFRRAIRDGETGFLASKPEDWSQYLRLLMNDSDRREAMAAAAYRDVLWKYGPERRVREVSLLLEIARGGQSGADAFERDVLRNISPTANEGGRPVVPRHKALFTSDNLGVTKVTVAVPLYNYEAVVTEALESAARQDLGRIDLVVVEDCSTDDSLKVVLDWASANKDRFNRLIVARNDINSGLAYTRNVAFALADTPWVLPLDADNRLLPSCARECVAMAERTGAAFVYPVIRQFGQRSDLMGMDSYDPQRLSNGNYIDAMALISRAAWLHVGGYDHIVGGWEDFDFWCRFAERGLRGEQASPQPLAEYRVHGTSMIQTAIKSAERINAMMNTLRERHPWLTLTWPLPSERPPH